MKKPKARGASKSAGRAKTRVRRSSLAWRSLLDGWALAPVVIWALGQLDAYVWLGALIAELHLHLALGLVVAGGAALALRRWVRATAWLLCALLFCVPLWPVWRPMHQTPFAGGATIEVAQSELAGAALSPAQLAAWLGRNRYDVVSVTGLRPTQRAQLVPAAHGYSVRRGLSPGALLLARTTLTPRLKPGAELSLDVGHCQLEVEQLILPSLLSPSAATPRSALLRSLVAARPGKRSLYLGSLGSRSAAADLQPLLRELGLRDVRSGHGRLATGPGNLGPLGLPLDHILVHGWIAVVDAEVADPLVPGAHRTLRAKLQLTEPRCR